MTKSYLVAAFAFCAAGFCALGAEKFEIGDFILNYSVTNSEVTILGCERREGSPKDANPVFSIKIPSKIEGTEVVNIGDGAFAGFNGMKSVKIPDGVKTIGKGAFSNCTNLSSLKIPNSVTNIGARAFSRCRSAKSIEISENLKEIPAGCFFDCRSISNVSLPEGLLEIGEEAFWDCSDITKITIPSSVTNIGNRAFFDCNKLTVASFLGKQPAVGDDSFDGVHVTFEFRASPQEWKDEVIPGTWQGHEIKDLTIETYRKLIFLPFIIGAIGTIVIMLVAIILRDRSKGDEDEDDF